MAWTVPQRNAGFVERRCELAATLLICLTWYFIGSDVIELAEDI
jgi:hypothetical protein